VLAFALCIRRACLWIAVLCGLLTPIPVVYAQTGVSIAFNSTGLSSLQYNGTEYINYGDLRLDQITFGSPGGSTFSGSTSSTVAIDPIRQTQTRTYNWGSIVVAYSVTSSNRLSLTVTVNNASSSPIQ
jgi:hypothetical protein